jgi:hypothetical protein
MLMGCSSDSGTDITIKQGDPNDAAFLAVRAEVSDVVDELVDKTQEPLTNPWNFPLDSLYQWPDYGSLNPDDTIDYDYNDGWYTLYVGTFAASNVSVVVDSVMFTRNGSPTPRYDWRTEGIQIIRHITDNYDGEETDYTEHSIYYSGSITGVNQAKSYADANSEYELDTYSLDGTSTVHVNSVYTITVNDVEFDRADIGSDWDSSVPYSGSINMTVARTTETTVNNNTTNTSRVWNITVTFSSNGTATVEVISNNTRWSYSDTYGS